MSRLRPAVGKGLFLAIGVLAAAAGVYGTNLIQEAEATKDWPTVQGKIIASEVRPGEDESSGRPRVRFEYAVGGSIYHSEQYRTGAAGQAMNIAAAQALVEKYPIGAQVRVYHDPLNPAIAVLEQGDPTRGYAICSAAVVLLGVGAILTIGHRKQAKLANVKLAK